MSRRAGSPRGTPLAGFFCRRWRPASQCLPTVGGQSPQSLGRGRRDGGSGRIHKVVSRMPVGQLNLAESRVTVPSQTSAGQPAELEPAGKPVDFYARPKFPKDDGFQAELGRRVAAYFQKTGKRDRDCWQMYLK